jgi:hypothetical protein
LAEIESQRAISGKVSEVLLGEMKAPLDQLQRRLKEQVGEFSFNDYVEARRFLVQLRARAEGSNREIEWRGKR